MRAQGLRRNASATAQQSNFTGNTFSSNTQISQQSREAYIHEAAFSPALAFLPYNRGVGDILQLVTVVAVAEDGETRADCCCRVLRLS